MSQQPDTTDGHLLKAIANACDGRIIQIPAPMAVAAIYPDRSPPFKTIKLKGTEEFLLAGARIGNRQPVILKLTPMDAVDYEAIELESNKVTQFEALDKHLVDHLGGYFNLLLDEAGADGLDAPFISSGHSFNGAIVIFRREVEPLLGRIKANRLAEAERDAALAYADNDDWGTW
ncbi:hypothetical protein ABID82_005075 [Methylobacterium sp. PvP062]|uniref:Uncharacterized protein n=1 Tax=Methylobacterium radiotolerans TaxID=31998 RepID=A0ABV2NU20_9HYPH|nr:MULTISPECIES: hypothetical protein [unclassified Methylobacterium]MBP2498389.1 hypothetical protein [Methylobacterium sp. PvP105]MBP2505773.1 hypothetical protein [Methylobacterium sp. PvP109]